MQVNSNNPNIYSTIKSSCNCLKNISFSGFYKVKLEQSKQQPPNIKKRLAEA